MALLAQKDRAAERCAKHTPRKSTDSTDLQLPPNPSDTEATLAQPVGTTSPVTHEQDCCRQARLAERVKCVQIIEQHIDGQKPLVQALLRRLINLINA